MNNAALIEVFRGDLCGAQQVCKMHLRWAARMVRVHGVVAAGEFGVQPWINLGRLRRIQGDYEGALQHFTLFVDTLASAPVHIDSLTFDAAAWQELVHARSLLPMLKGVYVVDSVKTYSAARGDAAAAEFLHETRELMKEQPIVLLNELEFIALLRLRRFDDALAVLEREGWRESDYAKLLRLTYRVALRAAAGDVSQSKRILAELADRVLRSGGFNEPGDPRILRFLHYFGGLARRLDLEGLAAQIWRLGLDAARHLDDVPSCLASLEALIGIETMGEREALQAERAALLRECLYVSLLKARGVEIDPIAASAPVFTELHHRLRAIAEQDISSWMTESAAPAPAAGFPQV